MPGEIFQLVYRSTYCAGRIDNTLRALREIVKASSRNNETCGVTGYLVFDGKTFLQILEGPKTEVMATFARIEADPRHRNAAIIQSSMVAQRAFSVWAMGGVLRRMPIPEELSGEDVIEFAKELASAEKPAAA